jgi:hypothetical protein
MPPLKQIKFSLICFQQAKDFPKFRLDGLEGGCVH